MGGESGITCVVTGFDAFGEHEKNPSEMAVWRLPETLNVGKQSRVRVVKGVLPTCCQGGWDVLKDIVKGAGDVRLIVMCGVAGKRDAIALERFALNIRDYRIPDNQGHQWEDEPVVAGGAEAIRTNLPVRKLAEALRAAGFRAEASNHAGAYICNETYYRALSEWQGDGRDVLFVHVPDVDGYRKEGQGEEDVVQEYTEAIQLLIEEALKSESTDS